MRRSRQIGLISVVVILLIFAVFISIANTSKWGYQVGDRYVSKVTMYNGTEFTNYTYIQTVAELTLTQIRIDKKIIWANESPPYEESLWLDKDTETPFDEDRPHGWSNGSVEMLTTPMGDVSCQVFVFDDGTFHVVSWMHKGLLVHSHFERLDTHAYVHSELIEVPAKYL